VESGLHPEGMIEIVSQKASHRSISNDICGARLFVNCTGYEQTVPFQQPGTCPAIHTTSMPLRYHPMSHLCGNGNLDLDTSLNVDDDLLDNLGRGVEINQTLVDSHLKHIPGLGTFTVGGLSGGDLEVLGGQTDGSLDTEVLALGTLDELGADLLEGLDLARGQGDADLVDLGRINLRGLLCVLETGHVGGFEVVRVLCGLLVVGICGVGFQSRLGDFV